MKNGGARANSCWCTFPASQVIVVVAAGVDRDRHLPDICRTPDHDCASTNQQYILGRSFAPGPVSRGIVRDIESFLPFHCVRSVHYSFHSIYPSFHSILFLGGPFREQRHGTKASNGDTSRILRRTDATMSARNNQVSSVGASDVECII